jgi:hypothetical protein
MEILLNTGGEAPNRGGCALAASVCQITPAIAEINRLTGVATPSTSSPIPLAAVATELDTGLEISLQEGPVIDAVCASIAIPCAFTRECRHAVRDRFPAARCSEPSRTARFARSSDAVRCHSFAEVWQKDC